MKERTSYYSIVFFCLLALLIQTGLGFFSQNDTVKMIYGDLILVVISLFILILSYRTYKKISPKLADERKIILLFTGTFFLRLIGEVLWAYNELAKKETLYISAADIGWYLSYILLLIGLGYYIRNIFIANKAKVVSATIGFATLLSALVLWIEVLIPGWTSREDLLSHLVVEAYVIFDIYIVALLALVMIPMMRSYTAQFKSSLFIAYGFISFSIFDLVYARQTIAGTYVSGNIIDIAYLLGYVLILIGSYLSYASNSEVHT